MPHHLILGASAQTDIARIYTLPKWSTHYQPGLKEIRSKLEIDPLGANAAAGNAGFMYCAVKGLKAYYNINGADVEILKFETYY